MTSKDYVDDWDINSPEQFLIEAVTDLIDKTYDKESFTKDMKLRFLSEMIDCLYEDKDYFERH